MKYKLLVAEDELIERKMLCKTLHKHLGEQCTILETKNGREAMEVFERESPHIVILDIEMPGINGLEVARRIRQSQKPCVILFLTGFDKFSYAKQAISVRALDYLLKPYNEKELILSVEEAIRYASHFAQQQQPPLPPQPQNVEAEKAEENVEADRISLVREHIRDFIEAHYMEELSMQDVARAMGYSDAYFCKLFKQCFHVNFSTCLSEYRVEKAKRMMENPRINVKDISTACGYSDSNYFARVFKRITGQTPSEYRMRIIENSLKNS